MFCPNCGSSIKEGSAFCGECGYRIANAAAPAPAPVQPVAPAPAPVPAPAAPVAAQPTAVLPQPPIVPAAAPAPAPAAPVPAPAPAAPVPPVAPAPAPGAPTVPPVPGAPAAAVPGVPGQPVPPAVNPVIRDLIAPASLKAMGAALGIGLAAALVLSLLGSIVFMSAGSSSGSSPISSQMNQLFGQLDAVGNKPNFIQMLFFLMVVGVGGQVQVSGTAGSSFGGGTQSVEGTIWFMVGLPGVALLLGVAFGAYMIARGNALKFKWTGLISSVLVSLVTGLLYIILSAIFAIHMNTGIGDVASISMTSTGVSFRTFLMAFLLSLIGAFAGYALAQYAPDSNNVFSSFRCWMRRSRGWMHTAAESAFVYTVVAVVLALITLIWMSVQGKDGSLIGMLPVLFPLFPIALTVIGSFGSLTVYSGNYDQAINVFNMNMWQMWIVFVIMLVVALYLGLREAARNTYDPTFGGWANCWKSPLASAVIWLLLSFAFVPFGTESSSSSTQGIKVAEWFFLVAAVWAFLIELIALVLGPTIIASAPGLWGLLRGGCVEQTPQEVVDYVNASGAHFLAKYGNTVPAGAGAGAAVVANAAAAPVAAGAVPPVPGAPAVPAAQTGQPGAPGATTNYAIAAAPAAAAAVPGVPGAVAAKPMTAQQKRLIVIIAAVVAAFAALGITYAVLSNTVFSAQSAASGYINAIAAGQFSKASEQADPQLGKAQRALLVDAASNGDNVRISNPRVSKTEDQADGSVKATVTYTLDGKEKNDTITIQSNGSKFLLFKDWKITTPLVKYLTVNVPESVDTVTVNGVSVTKDNAREGSDDTSWTLAVYPGTYKLGIAKSKYMTAKEVTLRTADSDGGDSGVGTLEVEPTTALQNEIETQVKAKLDACAQSKEREPEGCPFSFYGSSDDYRNFVWTISEYPTIGAISLDSGSFTTESSGEVKLTYDYKNYKDKWEPESDTNSFSVYGGFTIEGDKVSVELSD
ncbi:zinc ribbon domain-containing protein [Bifidobacterium jacchi]|uniref:Zinc ribbon domain-containing protein n=1 Tax=Bifidobacterium jacchi TaxID=2490545 RepID=A0A5N5RDM3_9BIFI|nr:zinc ribbon domain-containing protein [Bifidobacterium jacchi]KAB5605377.1 zinc ribbon domain-containing protein [Bifidobacterium jacchi]